MSDSVTSDNPLDEFFADPVRAKEMYFHRCALAHEREDELRAEIDRLVRRQQELEEALREIADADGLTNPTFRHPYLIARAVLDRKGNEMSGSAALSSPETE